MRARKKTNVRYFRERRNGRLGLQKYPKGSQLGVPIPLQLNISGARIIRLIAGGMYMPLPALMASHRPSLGHSMPLTQKAIYMCGV